VCVLPLLPIIHPERGLLGGREVSWDLLLYLAGGAPFGGAEDQGLEAGALHCRVVLESLACVAEHAMEYACLAVVHREYERFLAA